MVPNSMVHSVFIYRYLTKPISPQRAPCPELQEFEELMANLGLGP